MIEWHGIQIIGNKNMKKEEWRKHESDRMKKVNKQCLLDTSRTVRVGEKTWQVIVQTSRP